MVNSEGAPMTKKLRYILVYLQSEQFPKQIAAKVKPFYNLNKLLFSLSIIFRDSFLMLKKTACQIHACMAFNLRVRVFVVIVLAASIG